MSKITIHIGLHKTGTTFLQEQLLNSIQGFSLIRGWNTHRKLMDVALNNQIIISDEGISGNLWNGSYGPDFFINIDKIRKIYGNPRIIFGIRNQKTFILSIYKQYLHEKGYQAIDYLFNQEDTGMLKHADVYLFPKIEYLRKYFTDVFIYSQESLLQRPEDFLNALTTFLEIKNPINFPKKEKVNVGINTEFQVKTLKKLNEINRRLEHINNRLSLYSNRLRKWNLTPRNICQSHLQNVKSAKYDLPPDLMEFITKKYAEDWFKASGCISY